MKLDGSSLLKEVKKWDNHPICVYHEYDLVTFLFFFLLYWLGHTDAKPMTDPLIFANNGGRTIEYV